MQAKKTLSIASVLLAGTLTVTGCGSSTDNHDNAAAGSSTGASATPLHNKADIVFAQDMVPHHGQAIDMAKMAKARAASPQVKKLASDIQAAQGPEIARMTGGLRSWGVQVPATNMAGMPGMDHGSESSSSGMMSNADMHRLGKAHGAPFDRMFLAMMIKHHEGALQMARTEQAGGKNPAALKLARSITSSQAAQIAEMRQMLNA